MQKDKQANGQGEGEFHDVLVDWGGCALTELREVTEFLVAGWWDL
jgi:hypothetical protein